MSFDRNQLANSLTSGPTVRVVVVKTEGSAPREAGASMIVSTKGTYGTIGGGALEYSVIETARTDLAAGRTHPRVSRIPLGTEMAQCCGGRVTLVNEYFYSQDDLPKPLKRFERQIEGAEASPFLNGTNTHPNLSLKSGWLSEAMAPSLIPLWIYGAGHVGRAIQSKLEGLPFDLTWVDIDTERFLEPLPSSALIAADPDLVARHAPDLAHHLIVTHDHALDLRICNQLLRQPTTSIGLIGSKTKWARFRKRLQALGHSPEIVQNIRCPIGDPSLGKSPNEIAIGVVAELLAIKDQPPRFPASHFDTSEQSVPSLEVPST